MLEFGESCGKTRKGDKSQKSEESFQYLQWSYHLIEEVRFEQLEEG